ncbi:MAG TPA: hypothetical protein VK809_13280 [Bacteroidia bacterium]|nr:hypothetical protein [Bacteroidia bacterium]
MPVITLIGNRDNIDAEKITFELYLIRMQSLQKIFLKSASKPLFWIVLGFIFKGIPFLFVILNHPYQDIQGIWGATQADDSSYLLPIDNFIHNGIYTPDFRMPGYGAFYLFFRLVFSPEIACNILIVLQVVLASVSVYYLALIARNILKNEICFYITFYLFILCPYSNFFDAYIATESLSASLLIFGVYFFTQYYQINKKRYLFIAGLLLTLVMFIRPVFGGILAICILLMVLQKSIGFSMKIKQLFLFVIPLLVLEGLWVYRNYQTHNKFMPFTTTGAFYPNAANSYLQPLFEFTQSWGGACTLTNKPADINWFQYYYPGMPSSLPFDSLPDNIYTSEFNKDSLLKLKEMIACLKKPTPDSASIQNKLRLKLNKYRLSVKREKAFQYYIKAPLQMIGVMLFGPVTRDYLDRGQSVPIIGKPIVIFNYWLYLFILLSGLAGILLIILNGIRQNSLLLIIPLIPLYIILVHPFIFRFFDSRFLLPVFPFIISCSSYLITIIYRQFTQQYKKGY